MSLLRKVRVLVGALVHKPFTPRPEKVDLEEDESRQAEASLAKKEPEVADSERVADLIAEGRRAKADQD